MRERARAGLVDTTKTCHVRNDRNSGFHKGPDPGHRIETMDCEQKMGGLFTGVLDVASQLLQPVRMTAFTSATP